MDPMNPAPIALSVLVLLALAAPGHLLFAQSASQPPQYPNFPSETPARLEPAIDSFDYTRRDSMIPMRDSVKLHTVIIVPKDAKNAPVLLTRTP
jgi:predicted acyl esterase